MHELAQKCLKCQHFSCGRGCTADLSGDLTILPRTPSQFGRGKTALYLALRRFFLLSLTVNYKTGRLCLSVKQ